jgi:hypothetical protein
MELLPQMTMELTCLRPTTFRGRRYKRGETVEVIANYLTWEMYEGDIDWWITAYAVEDSSAAWAVSWPRRFAGTRLTGRDVASHFDRVAED